MKKTQQFSNLFLIVLVFVLVLVTCRPATFSSVDSGLASNKWFDKIAPQECLDKNKSFTDYSTLKVW